MSITIKFPDLFVKDAEFYARAMNCSIPEKIEYWARLGKLAEENPDLPTDMLKDIFISIKELKSDSLIEYQFRKG